MIWGYHYFWKHPYDSHFWGEIFSKSRGFLFGMVHVVCVFLTNLGTPYQFTLGNSYFYAFKIWGIGKPTKFKNSPASNTAMTKLISPCFEVYCFYDHDDVPVTCLENKLLLISINFTPKTSHSCLRKRYTRFSRCCLKNDEGGVPPTRAGKGIYGMC